jgi:hypothetical protein
LSGLRQLGLVLQASAVHSERARGAEGRGNQSSPRLGPFAARLIHRMSALNEQLVAIENEVAGAEQRVQNQLGLVETLVQDGHDTQPAIDLLSILEHTLRLLQDRQDYLTEQIGREISTETVPLPEITLSMREIPEESSEVDGAQGH